MVKKIFIVLILFVNIVENLCREWLGIMILKLLLFFLRVNFFWFRWWEFVVIVFNFLCWFNIKWIFVKIGWFFCVFAVKVVLLIIFLSNFVLRIKGVFVEIFWICGYCLLFFFFRVIFDLLLVKIIWFCLIFLKLRVILGRLDIILMKKEVLRRIEFKEVINKLVFLFFWEIKFLIEIWLFELIKVIFLLVMLILMVDKIGMVFLELIVFLVVFKVCRNKFLLIEKWIMDFFLFIFSIRRIIVIIEFVKFVENRF